VSLVSSLPLRVCQGDKCKEVLGLECVELLLSTSDSPETEAKNKGLLARYETQLHLSFVDDNEQLQWCPASGCSNVVKNTSKLRTVKCTCSPNQFCFACSTEAHAPCSCQEAAEWTLKDTGCNLDMKVLRSQAQFATWKHSTESSLCNSGSFSALGSFFISSCWRTQKHARRAEFAPRRRVSLTAACGLHCPTI
jgi:hypothetical protein